MKVHAFLLAVLCASQSAVNGAQYQITDLGTALQGSRATCINSSGVIVGYSWQRFDEYDLWPDYRPHVWVPTTNGYVKINLPLLPDGDTATATNYPYTMPSGGLASGINNSGVIIGYSLRDWPASGAGRGRAAKWVANTNGYEVTDLGIPGTDTRFSTTNVFSDARAINSQGSIAGNKTVDYDTYEYWHYFTGTVVSTNSTNEFIPTAFHEGLTGSMTFGINDLGDAVGGQVELGGESLAFVVTNGTYTILSSLNTNSGNVANSINTNRIIAGVSDQKAVFWGTDGSITNIHDGNLGASSIAHNINNIGQIVGSIASTTAFLWDSQNGMRTLDSLCEDANWLIQGAYWINDSGYIVGFGTKWDAVGECWESQTRAVLLTPVQ